MSKYALVKNRPFSEYRILTLTNDPRIDRVVSDDVFRKFKPQIQNEIKNLRNPPTLYHEYRERSNELYQLVAAFLEYVYELSLEKQLMYLDLVVMFQERFDISYFMRDDGSKFYDSAIKVPQNLKYLPLESGGDISPRFGVRLMEDVVYLRHVLITTYKDFNPGKLLYEIRKKGFMFKSLEDVPINLTVIRSFDTDKLQAMNNLVTDRCDLLLRLCNKTLRPEEDAKMFIVKQPQGWNRKVDWRIYDVYGALMTVLDKNVMARSDDKRKTPGRLIAPVEKGVKEEPTDDAVKEFIDLIYYHFGRRGHEFLINQVTNAQNTIATVDGDEYIIAGVSHYLQKYEKVYTDTKKLERMLKSIKYDPIVTE